MLFLASGVPLPEDAAINPDRSRASAVLEQMPRSPVGRGLVALKGIAALSVLAAGELHATLAHAQEKPVREPMTADKSVTLETEKYLILLGSEEFTERESASDWLLKRQLSHDEFTLVARARHHADLETRKRADEVFRKHQPRFAGRIDVVSKQVKELLKPTTSNMLPWLDGMPADFVFPQWFTPRPGGTGAQVAQMYQDIALKKGVACDTKHFTNYTVYTQLLVDELAPAIALAFYGREDLMNQELERFQSLLDTMWENNDEYCRNNRGGELRPRWQPVMPPVPEAQPR